MKHQFVFAAALTLATATLLPLATTAKPTPKPAQGGAMQRTSVEGCMNQFLFDGVWRLKVLGFERGTYGGGDAGYAVRVQLRNGTAKQEIVSYTGVGGEYGRNINLVMSDDSSVPVETVGSNTADYNAFIKATVPPGAAANGSLKFYPAKTVLDTPGIVPKKLLIEIDPKAINPNILPFHYPLADPSFRVHLDCDKAKPTS